MNERHVLAPKYMREFRCIGGACESSCCQWWRIDIDRNNYKDLKKAMAKASIDREKFRKSVKRNRKDSGNDRHFAKIALDGETGLCPFVDEKGLCEIHCRFGEKCLSITCRTYPRVVNDIFGNLAMGAVLSCPEVARKCLVDPDSMSLVTLGPEEISTSGLALGGQCNDASLPYKRYVDEIRSIFMEFLSARQYPIVFRLFFLAYLSHRVSDFFNQDTRNPEFDEERLAAEVARLSDPAMLEELCRRYQALEASMELPLKFINSILSSKEGNPISGSLFRDVFKFYKLEEDTWEHFLSEGGELASGIVKDVIDSYVLRRDRIISLFSEQMDIYLENFCKNHCMIFLYTDVKSISEFVESMIFRVAIGVFILFSHPSMGELLQVCDREGGEGRSESSRKILDSLVVESFFKFSRCIEHDKLLWGSIYSAMRTGNLSGLPYMIQLLKFIA